MTKHDFMNTWNRSCYAQFAFAVRNWLKRTAFEYETLSTLKTKRRIFISFLFSLCIVGVCFLKKITSWIQVTSSRQRIFGKMDFWISHQGIAFILCFVLKVSAKESKFVFFSSAFITVSVCLNSHPVRLSANGKQISLLARRSDVCFCCPGKPCWEKESFWFYLVGEKSRFISNKGKPHK